MNVAQEWPHITHVLCSWQNTTTVIEAYGIILIVCTYHLGTVFVSTNGNVSVKPRDKRLHAPTRTRNRRLEHEWYWVYLASTRQSNLVHTMSRDALHHLPLDKMAAILIDDIFKCIFLNENDCIPYQISLKFVFPGVQLTINQHWPR